MGLPMAMVTAKPRKGNPRIPAIISAECALSMGSRNTLCRSDAVFARRAALIPAMVSASALAINRRVARYSPATFPAARGVAETLMRRHSYGQAHGQDQFTPRGRFGVNGATVALP